MGLFRNILRAAGTVAKKPSSKYPEPVAPAPPTCVTEGYENYVALSGDCEREVYVYYGEPLSGIKIGEYFGADIVTEPLVLTSALTGGTWDTSDNGVALAYRGMVFGAASALGQTLSKIVRNGTGVTVRCRMVGWYAPGIPDVIMTIPDPDEIFAWVDACEGLGRFVAFDKRHDEECEAATSKVQTARMLSKMCGRELPVGVDGDCVYIEDDKWAGKRKNGIFPVEVSTELIPTPRGSKAKPHVAVFVNGAMAADVSARCVHYKTLAEHAGERPYFACCQKREGHDGSPIWRVTVVYLGR